MNVWRTWRLILVPPAGTEVAQAVTAGFAEAFDIEFIGADLTPRPPSLAGKGEILSSEG